MPIVFQQPELIAPGVASAYGAAEIGQRNNSVLAGLYSDANRINMQSRLGTAEMQQQGAIARSQQETTRGVNEARLQEEGRQFDQARLDRQAAQEFAYRHDAAQAMQKSQLTAWLNDQELSQREEMRLRTMKNSVADILANSSNDLSDEEKIAAVNKLRTGIDVYEMRQRKALANQEESRASQYQNQVRMVRQSESEADRIEAKAKDQGIGVMRRYDPHTGTVNILFRNPQTGMWYNPDVTHASEGMGKGGRMTTRFGDESGTFSYKNAMPEAKAEAEAAFPIDKQPGPDGKDMIDANAGKRAEYMQRVLQRMKDEHAVQTGRATGQDEHQGQVAAAAAAGAEQTVRSASERLAAMPNLPPLQRQQAEQSMRFLQSVAAKYGSSVSPNVPPELRDQVQMAENVLRGLPEPPKTKDQGWTSRTIEASVDAVAGAGREYGKDLVERMASREKIPEEFRRPSVAEAAAKRAKAEIDRQFQALRLRIGDKE